MKTAHDLVVQAKQTVQEISVEQAVAAIQTCDVLVENFAPGALDRDRKSVV